MPLHLPFKSLFCARSLVQEDLIADGSTPLVSVSGGQDSMFLAWFVLQLQAEKKLCPLWLYHNHLWHAEGFFHGLHCLRLAFLFGWPFIYTVPIHPAFDEEMAWDFRQQLRGRLCIFYALDDILLGHTKTDQTESFLFHLLRGSFPVFPALPAQRHFASSTPTLFALEGSSLSFDAPTFTGSACERIRRKSFV